MKKESKVPVKVITSLDDLQNLCARPIKVKFKYAGAEVEIETRHLTPTEAELLKLQLDELIPPVLKGKTETEDRFDYNNVDFLKKKTRIEREVRAQAIFWTTKAFQDKKPELVADKYSPTNRRAILEFVQSMLTEDVLELIYVQITEPDVSIPEQVNFTSPGGSS